MMRGASDMEIALWVAVLLLLAGMFVLLWIGPPFDYLGYFGRPGVRW